jgi:hypothetical protein
MNRDGLNLVGVTTGRFASRETVISAAHQCGKTLAAVNAMKALGVSLTSFGRALQATLEAAIKAEEQMARMRAIGREITVEEALRYRTDPFAYAELMLHRENNRRLDRAAQRIYGLESWELVSAPQRRAAKQHPLWLSIMYGTSGLESWLRSEEERVIYGNPYAPEPAGFLRASDITAGYRIHKTRG